MNLIRYKAPLQRDILRGLASLLAEAADEGDADDIEFYLDSLTDGLARMESQDFFGTEGLLHRIRFEI